MSSFGYDEMDDYHELDAYIEGDCPACQGQVEIDSPGDDEDGWPIPVHLCRGHRGAYDWHVEGWSYRREEPDRDE